jgi:hypothetical protein
VKGLELYDCFSTARVQLSEFHLPSKNSSACSQCDACSSFSLQSAAVACESEAHRRLKNVDRTEEDVENVQVL